MAVGIRLALVYSDPKLLVYPPLARGTLRPPHERPHVAPAVRAVDFLDDGLDSDGGRVHDASMRLVRALVFIPAVVVFWVATDFLLQIAYAVFPTGSQDTVISGHFDIGRYRFDTELFAVLSMWAAICLFILLSGLYRILFRGTTLRGAIKV